MKKKMTYDNLITYILFIILIATLIYNYVYRGGDKIGRLLLTMFTIIAVKTLFKVTFLKKSKAAYILIVTFIMISMYLGNVFDFYGYIKNYDKVLHFLSGMIISLLSIIIYSYFTQENINNINKKFVIFFSFIFITSLAGLWEIWEFTTDRIFGFQAQCNSLTDTMLDIISGTLGGVFLLILIYLLGIRRKSKILERIIEEVLK